MRKRVRAKEAYYRDVVRELEAYAKIVQKREGLEDIETARDAVFDIIMDAFDEYEEGFGHSSYREKNI